MTEEKTEVTEIQPVKVTVVGMGTGAGTPLVSGVTAVTPDHLPNVVLKVISPVMAIAIRFINSFLVMLVSLVGAGMTTNIIPASDFLSLVLSCAKLSVAAAGFAALKDLVTIFGKLEGKYPLLTGSV